MFDYTLPSKELIVSLINQRFNFSFTPEELILGTPRHEGETLADTYLEYRRVGFDELSHIQYRRLDLSTQVFAEQPVELFNYNHMYDTLPDVLTHLNEIKAIGLDNEDIHVESGPAWPYLPLLPELAWRYLIKARPSSLMYVGQVEVFVRLPQPGIELATLIVDAELDGFSVSDL